MALSESQRRILLQAARGAVRARLAGGAAQAPPAVDEILLEPRGAFVSVHHGEELRGCIGFIEPRGPLIETVMEAAVAAATADYRFAPLTALELPGVTFEISVLSPILPVTDPRSIDVGVHGVMLAGRGRKGLLLPQVASQHGWDLEEFLDAACRKADLPRGAWRSRDVSLAVFTAEVFGEPPGASAEGGA